MLLGNLKLKIESYFFMRCLKKGLFQDFKSRISLKDWNFIIPHGETPTASLHNFSSFENIL